MMSLDSSRAPCKGGEATEGGQRSPWFVPQISSCFCHGQQCFLLQLPLPPCSTFHLHSGIWEARSWTSVSAWRMIFRCKWYFVSGQLCLLFVANLCLIYLANFVSYLWPTFVSYIWPTLSPICGQLLSHISDQLCLLFVANLLKRRTSETRVENTRRHIARTKTSCRDKQIIRQIKNHIIRTNSPGRASSEAQHRWKVHFCCWVNELQASCLFIVREQHKANLFLVTK